MSPRETSRARWILVADGDKSAADRLAGILLRARFRAYPVASGLEALRLAQRYRLGLAIVDVGLLDMTGFDLVRRLRSGAPELPVVAAAQRYALTGSASDRQRFAHLLSRLKETSAVVDRGVADTKGSERLQLLDAAHHMLRRIDDLGREILAGPAAHGRRTAGPQ